MVRARVPSLTAFVVQPPKDIFDPPELYSVHQGTVTGVHGFGAFVSLDGSWDKDALIHVTQLKVAEDGERVETVDVVKEGDRVFVKVIDIAFLFPISLRAAGLCGSRPPKLCALWGLG